MTTPIEALTYISNARWNENADLDDICTMADRALASLEGDAVERVASKDFARVYSAISAARDVLRGYSKIDYDADNNPQPNFAFEVEQQCKEAMYILDECSRGFPPSQHSPSGITTPRPGVGNVSEVMGIIKSLHHAASGRSDRLQQTAAIDMAISFLYTLLATGLVAGEAAIRAAHIKVLRGLLYSCAEQANVTGPDKTTGRHMINLIDTIERSPDMPVDKIARWTGFIQGVLAARGLLDVDEERNRTRPIFAAAQQEQNDASN